MPCVLWTHHSLLMKSLLLFLAVVSTCLHAAEPKVLLEEGFTSELSKDWFWGLGTWSAKDGVLRGFESGPRRHGPVKMRRLHLTDAVIEFDYRLTGKATFAGIVFNGDQERGHILHLVAAKDSVRLIAHPKKGANATDLFKETLQLPANEWHHIRIELKGDACLSSVDGHEFRARNACIAEPKETFGLSGDSGGPEGEKAGALEFRALKITSL